MKLLKNRAITGRNIYSTLPVVRLTFKADPENLEIKSDLLKALFPGISSIADISQPSVHLAEAIALAALRFQHLIEIPVDFSTFGVDKEPDTFLVVFQCDDAYSGEAIGKLAFQAIKALYHNETFTYDESLELISSQRERRALGPSTGAIFQEARALGIPVTRLNDCSLLRLGYGHKQKLIQATIEGQTPYLAVELSCDKELTNHLLRTHHIPVPKGMVARNEKDAVEAARRIGFPVVLKPVSGNQGKGVSLNLTSYEDVEQAYQAACRFDRKVLVESYIRGNQYRVLVVGKKVVAAAMRSPAHVIGDGRSTIEELIRIENLNPLRGDGHAKAMSKIPVDEVTQLVLKKNNLSLKSVPEKGQAVALRENDNLSTGGMAVDVTDDIHESVKQVCIEAAEIIGVQIAGIDVTVSCISKDIWQERGAIIEVNSAPGIRMHHYPSKGTPRNVAREIVLNAFPEPKNASIPIVAVTGTNGKTTTSRMVSAILRRAGHHVGMTTSDGIYLGERLVEKGDTTGPDSALQVLSNKFVTAAVLETARGGIIRRGLAYDQADVAIVTNLTEDHLGLDGIESMEEMAAVKGLIAEAVRPNGSVILNADDAHCSYMITRAKGQVVLFSARGDNPLVARHIKKGGHAVVIRSQIICLLNGSEIMPLMSLEHIPATWNGLLVHNTENALAAIAAAHQLKVPVEHIREAMEQFYSNHDCSPGRFNTYNVQGRRVIFDYGHNLAGYKRVIDAVSQFNVPTLRAVIGIGGDRPDEMIREVGALCGSSFGSIIIREDLDLRGRESGAVASLLKQGILMSGLKPENCEYIADEITALETAIRKSAPGDCIVVFYEKLDKMKAVIDKLGAMPDLEHIAEPMQIAAMQQENAGFLNVQAQ